MVLETIDNIELKAILEKNSPSPMIVPGTYDAAKARCQPDAPAGRRDRRRHG